MSSSPTESLGQLRARLRGRALASSTDPRDADLLLCHALGRTLAYVISHSEDPVDPRVAADVTRLLDRRLASEPLQYIRGSMEFYGREFAVDSRALIPRPETELLVEAAIARIGVGHRVLDIGTGTGCIAISIERERPDVHVIGSDRSIAALALARHNARRLESQVRLVAGDYVAPIAATFELVVSNPPYIPTDVVEGLAEEVRAHEPRGALTPGPRGTEAFEALLQQVPAILAPHGRLMLEIGFDQAVAIRALASQAGWIVDEIVPDLAGILRVVVLSR